MAWYLFSGFPSPSIMSHCCPPKTHFFQQFRYPKKRRERQRARKPGRIKTERNIKKVNHKKKHPFLDQLTPVDSLTTLSSNPHSNKSVGRMKNHSKDKPMCSQLATSRGAREREAKSWWVRKGTSWKDKCGTRGCRGDTLPQMVNGLIICFCSLTKTVWN